MELGGVEVKPGGDDEQVFLADGRPTLLELRRLELSGRGPFSDVHFFLTRASLRHRLIDLETLAIRADEGGTVRFTALLAFPCAVPVGWIDLPADADPLAYMAARRQATDAKVRELALRANPARVLEALAAFDRLSGNRAQALTALRLDGELTLEGVVVAPASRASLRPALEAAGFKVGGERMEPLGACQRFAVNASIAPKESKHDPEDLQETVVDNGPFDSQAEKLCTAAAAAPAVGRVALRGTAPAEGALTLHLRAVDLRDVFFIPYELTGKSFLVDGNVDGRADVEVEGGSLAEVLAAMSSAGVRVGPGPLHRVSLATAPEAKGAPKGDYHAEVIDMRMQSARVVMTLCVLGMVAEQEISFPRDLEGQVDLFTTDLPADLMIDAVVASAGLESKVEKGGLFVGPKAAVQDPAKRGAVTSCHPPDAEEETPPGR